MRKKIILITYTFAPEQNPRAFRWQALATALSSADFDIDIILPKQVNVSSRPNIPNIKYYETERYPLYDLVNKYVFRNSSGGVAQIKKNNFSLKSFIKRIFSFIAKRFIWPDMCVFWVLPAHKKIKELIKKNKYDCVISSSPTFTCHLLGYYTKGIVKNIQWIAEYGDPYSFNPELPKSIFSLFNNKIEGNIIKNMDYVVVPIEKSKIGFLNHFSALQENKIKVIPQSFEHVRAIGGNINWSNFNDQLINIVYTGMLYSKIRNPEILLRSLLMLKKDNPDKYKKLRFHFFGHYKNVESIFSKYQELLNDKSIIIYGPVSRENCAFACQKANFLLNISNISDYQMPSKLIEYLSYKKPIISLENKKNSELNWPFLIKVNYDTKYVEDFLDSSFDNNIKISFDGYNDIIKNYSISKIEKQYMDLILENIVKDYEDIK